MGRALYPTEDRGLRVHGGGRGVMMVGRRPVMANTARFKRRLISRRTVDSTRPTPDRELLRAVPGPPAFGWTSRGPTRCGPGGGRIRHGCEGSRPDVRKVRNRDGDRTPASDRPFHSDPHTDFPGAYEITDTRRQRFQMPSRSRPVIFSRRRTKSVRPPRYREACISTVDSPLCCSSSPGTGTPPPSSPPRWGSAFAPSTATSSASGRRATRSKASPVPAGVSGWPRAVLPLRSASAWTKSARSCSPCTGWGPWTPTSRSGCWARCPRSTPPNYEPLSPRPRLPLPSTPTPPGRSDGKPWRCTHELSRGGSCSLSTTPPSHVQVDITEVGQSPWSISLKA